jgi:hypothetical protein
MAVQMPCPNCKKTCEPCLNPKTGEVSCNACSQKITVNHFVLQQLKALKQYGEVKKTVFSVKCPHCSKDGTPQDNGEDIVCASCHKSLNHLTEQFKRMLRLFLKKVDKDV